MLIKYWRTQTQPKSIVNYQLDSLHVDLRGLVAYVDIYFGQAVFGYGHERIEIAW